jgi:PAS domain S-box-containing protein
MERPTSRRIAIQNIKGMSLTSGQFAHHWAASASRTGGPAAPAANEGERLAALDRIGLCDTPESDAFDRITRLAARALDVPIVLVSLVGETRQWFKSKVGLDVRETPREVSFCAHAVTGRAPLIVSDAALDPRFAENPLVTGDPHIRSYAGIPLYTSDGHAIGTLCAIDRRARTFRAADLDALRDFAAMVEDLVHAMELAVDNERALYVATEQETLYRELFEHAPVGIVHASLSGQLLRANLHILALLGHTPESITALSFADITHPSDIPATAALVEGIRSGALDQCCVEKRYLRKDGTHFWGQMSLVLKRSSSGKPLYLISVIEDISARKQRDLEEERGREQLRADVARQAGELAECHGALHSHVVRAFDAERKCRQIEQRLRMVAACVPSMIGYWNRSLRCEFASEAHRDWFGLAPEQMLGMTLEELMGAEFDQLQPLARMALQGSAQRVQRTLRTLAGGKATLELRLSPDLDEAGQMRGFFLQMTGIQA